MSTAVFSRPSSAVRAKPIAPRELRAALEQFRNQPWADLLKHLNDKWKLEGTRLQAVLRQMDVDAKVVVRQGKPKVEHPLNGWVDLVDSAHDFYVDPADKLLKFNEERQRKLAARAQAKAKAQEEAAAHRKELSDQFQAHKVLSSWVVVELKPLEGSAFDVLLGRQVGAADTKDLALRYGRKGVYASAKRELTYRERLQLGLQ